MERDQVVSIVSDFLAEEFEVDPDDITDEALFKETIGLDSLDYIDLVVVIEAYFAVKLGEADFKQIITFNDFYKTIEFKMAEKA